MNTIEEILNQMLNAQSEAEMLQLTTTYNTLSESLDTVKKEIFDTKLRAVLLQKLSKMFNDLAETKSLFNLLEEKDKKIIVS